jgi:hypothetical protein
MNVNAKPLSELRRLEQWVTAAFTSFQQTINYVWRRMSLHDVLQTGVIEIYRQLMNCWWGLRLHLYFWPGCGMRLGSQYS